MLYRNCPLCLGRLFAKTLETKSDIYDSMYYRRSVQIVKTVGLHLVPIKGNFEKYSPFVYSEMDIKFSSIASRELRRFCGVLLLKL